MAETSYTRAEFPRREMPRHTASITASFQASGENFVGTIVNLSVTGAMVMGCYNLAPKSRIMMNIPDIGKVTATIMWNNGEALGLTFEGLSNAKDNVEMALAHTVNGLPEQADRRDKNQYTQPASVH